MLMIIIPFYFNEKYQFKINQFNEETINRKWTIMVYLSGESNLENIAWNAINRMKKGK